MLHKLHSISESFLLFIRCLINVYISGGFRGSAPFQSFLNPPLGCAYIFFVVKYILHRNTCNVHVHHQYFMIRYSCSMRGQLQENHCVIKDSNLTDLLGNVVGGRFSSCLQTVFFLMSDLSTCVARSNVDLVLQQISYLKSDTHPLCLPVKYYTWG